MKRPKLFIVDDNIAFRQSLIFLIHVEDCAKVIGKASDGFEFLEQMTYLRPDLILIDVDMPHLDGSNVIQKALDIHPDTKIIAFTRFEDDRYIDQLIKAGVTGFVLKSDAVSALENDIRSLLLNKNYDLNNKVLNIIHKIHPMKSKISSINRRLTEKINNQKLEFNLSTSMS